MGINFINISILLRYVVKTVQTVWEMQKTLIALRAMLWIRGSAVIRVTSL